MHAHHRPYIQHIHSFIMFIALHRWLSLLYISICHVDFSFYTTFNHAFIYLKYAAVHSRLWNAKQSLLSIRSENRKK